MWQATFCCGQSAGSAALVHRKCRLFRSRPAVHAVGGESGRRPLLQQRSAYRKLSSTSFPKSTVPLNPSSSARRRIALAVFAGDAIGDVASSCHLLWPQVLHVCVRAADLSRNLTAAPLRPRLKRQQDRVPLVASRHPVPVGLIGAKREPQSVDLKRRTPRAFGVARSARPGRRGHIRPRAHLRAATGAATRGGGPCGSVRNAAAVQGPAGRRNRPRPRR